MSLEQWWHVLRHHRPSQLTSRGLRILHRRLFPLLSHSRYTSVDAAAITSRENAGFDAIVARHLKLREVRDGETASDEGCRAASLMAGEFCFLNERRILPLPMDWELTTVLPVSPLWRFHLHYHEFLLDLLSATRRGDRPGAEKRLWAIVSDWITANPVSRPGALSDAWHPFCLSKRIAVWLMVWHASQPPAEFRETFATSLEGQIRFLERHLEWDLRGNHLLENLRTLALVGAFFDGPTAERRLERAIKLLRTQFAEQILPSGEHFERSPMYHAQMLSAVLDIRDATATVHPEFAQECETLAGRMGAFLAGILHPDGGVPLLSDSAGGETPHPGTLLRETACETTKSARETPRACASVVGECWTWRDGADYLLFDAGPVGADELPAHAHGDLLTLEASLDGQRVFVDSGVHDYDDGEMRRYCRSTAAHNVLQIDGVEQCDMWSRFRMGYRGYPSALEHGRMGDLHWSRATHNAYRRIGVPLVGRWLACGAGGPWICVDWAEGDGKHELINRLHLSPDVRVTSVNSHAVRIDVGERSIEVHSLTETEISIDQAWYCPDFGVRRESPVLTFTMQAELPAYMAWMAQDADRGERASLQIGKDGGIEVHWQTENGTIVLNPFSPAPR